MSSPPPSLAQIESNTAHVRHDALSALESLLQRESDPIYACGRAYLVNLTRWRDHLQQADGSLNTHWTKRGKAPEEEDETAATGFLSSPLRRREDTTKISPRTPRDRPTAAPALSPLGSRLATPSQCPHTLIDWRANMAMWLFDLADTLGFDRNTAVAALGYLDVYSMYCIFPEEFSRRTADIDVKSTSDIASTDYFSFTDDLGSISQKMYHLCAMSCFYTASKFYQTWPRVFTFAHAARVEPGFSEQEIECMEEAIVKTLTFHLNPASPKKFLAEMMVLLFDSEESTCESGRISEEGLAYVMKRNDSSLGTFRSLLWFPQNLDEVAIRRQSSYLADLVAYTCSFPRASSALPSKVALAAIIEAASDQYGRADQIAFEGRLNELSSLNEVFEYDNEINEIRSCMRYILHSSGEAEVMREQAGKSPVTVVETVLSAAKKLEFEESESTERHCKKVRTSASSESINSIDPEVNQKEAKGGKKRVSPSASNARVPNAPNDDGCTEGRVWEALEAISAQGKRSSSSSLTKCLFGDAKPKATKIVPQVIG